MLNKNSFILFPPRKNVAMTPEKRDHLDHLISPSIDHWEARAGVALALGALAPLLDDKQVHRWGSGLCIVIIYHLTSII